MLFFTVKDIIYLIGLRFLPVFVFFLIPPSTKTFKIDPLGALIPLPFSLYSTLSLLGRSLDKEEQGAVQSFKGDRQHQRSQSFILFFRTVEIERKEGTGGKRGEEVTPGGWVGVGAAAGGTTHECIIIRPNVRLHVILRSAR